MTTSVFWPTAAMVAYSRRFVPWAEERISEEVSSGYPALRGIPGSAAESSLEVFERLGPELAKKYMIQSLRRSALWDAPQGEDLEERSFLEATTLQLVEASSRRWDRPRQGFDRRSFLAGLPEALKECGHSSYLKSRNVISAKWASGRVEVETELIVGTRIMYFHRVKRAGEIACVQASLACWLSIDAATTYEPGAEHSPGQILEHLKRYWRVFLDAVPALAR